jgi:hypothetical protein
MARFETPINQPHVADALHGLDLQSVLLARDFERSSRLHAFVDQFVEPDTLQHETLDGQVHDYRHTRLSAIGGDGSLLHIRLHEQVQGQVIDAGVRNIAVISHVDDPNPATILFADSTDTVRFDGSRETTFVVGEPETDGLRSVDAPMNQLQWDMEQVLARELALASLPLVHMNGNGWEYRRSDRHWEKLRDIRFVRERVSRALSQGLGYAALPDVRPEAQEDTGQLDQKMVV